MISAASLFLAGGLLAASSLDNGDFQRGLEAWNTSHSWYAQPKDAGLSEITIAEGEGRSGTKALKITGRDNRGLAMQVAPAYAGRYRVAGWIKCENLDRGKAGILVEWMARENKYIRGDWAGDVSGTRDWQRIEAVLEAPANARSVHFDLITTEANRGTAWFDEIEFERLPSDLPPPVAPALTAITPAGRESCLEVKWSPDDLAAGTVRLILYAQPDSIDPAKALPRQVVDPDEGTCLIWSLENGREYHVAGVAINADGKASPLGAAVRAKVEDRQPPRPGWIEARQLSQGRAIRAGWSPHVLDSDAKTVHFCIPGADADAAVELAAASVVEVRGVPRPLYSTAPWLVRDFQPDGFTRLGVWCEDAAGNRSEIAWTDIELPVVDSTVRSQLWTVPPTEQVRQDAAPPAEPKRAFALVAMRGQAKGFQVVVRPEEELRRARIEFEPLRQENGAARIDPRWLAWHFVDYVKIDKNSRATPAEELVWPAPAEYPEELSDDLVRDLPAGKTQPIYIRATAPGDAAPGIYRGRAWLTSAGARQPFDITLRVSAVDLSMPARLPFVYWFSWTEPCKRFEVEQFSADGWRVLARLGELMRVHRQNVVVVPWSLVRSWRTADGGLRHDFNDFDRFIKTFQDEGVDRLFCLSHIGSRTTGDWLCPTMSSHRHTVTALASGEGERIDAVELLPELQRHIEELGLLERFSVHVADEPIRENVESYRELSRRVKEAAPRLRRIDAIHIPGLDGSLEIWVPQLNYLNQWLAEFKKAQQEGNELWFYVAWVPQGKYPNRMIDSHAIKPRVLHWLNAFYDTSGYLHWALNHWQISLSSLGSPGDQYICWPSRRYIADSSLRYEAEREGLEDWELFTIYRQKLEASGLSHDEAQQKLQAILAEAVRGCEDYTRSWYDLEATRGRVLAELEPKQ